MKIEIPNSEIARKGYGDIINGILAGIEETLIICYNMKDMVADDLVDEISKEDVIEILENVIENIKKDEHWITTKG